MPEVCPFINNYCSSQKGKLVIFMNIQTRTMALLTALTVSSVGLLPSAFAQEYHPLLHNQIIKQGAVGAGVGAAAGLLGGHGRHEGHSVIRGAGVGALTGAGTGLVSRSKILRGHPLAKTTAQGAIIGTGASVIFHKSPAKGALLGAGVGAGWHFLDQYLHTDRRY